MNRFKNSARLQALVVTTLLLAACGGGVVAETTTTSTTEPPHEHPSTTSTTHHHSSGTTVAPGVTTTMNEHANAKTIEIEFANGEVVGGAQTHEVGLGDHLHIVVTADVTDHVHIHGYDKFADVEPGTSVGIHLTVDVPGVFEIELESSHTLLGELEVS